MIRSYEELIQFKTFKERFDYLNLDGIVGEETFGFDRYINQKFYHSDEWLSFRYKVIVRDDGCNLGIKDMKIPGYILIHHINPITVDDIINHNPIVFDFNNVICTTFNTHRAIHYGDYSQVDTDVVIRKPNDTCPWRK